MMSCVEIHLLLWRMMVLEHNVCSMEEYIILKFWFGESIF